MQDKKETPVHFDKIDARGGSRSKVNRNVLTAGLILVILAFGVILGVGFLHTKDTGADKMSADNVAANSSK